jgi:hypothetical protein
MQTAFNCLNILNTYFIFCYFYYFFISFAQSDFHMNASFICVYTIALEHDSPITPMPTQYSRQHLFGQAANNPISIFLQSGTFHGNSHTNTLTTGHTGSGTGHTDTLSATPHVRSLGTTMYTSSNTIDSTIRLDDGAGNAPFHNRLMVNTLDLDQSSRNVSATACNDNTNTDTLGNNLRDGNTVNVSTTAPRTRPATDLFSPGASSTWNQKQEERLRHDSMDRSATLSSLSSVNSAYSFSSGMHGQDNQIDATAIAAIQSAVTASHQEDENMNMQGLASNAMGLDFNDRQGLERNHGFSASLTASEYAREKERAERAEREQKLLEENIHPTIVIDKFNNNVVNINGYSSTGEFNMFRAMRKRIPNDPLTDFTIGIPCRIQDTNLMVCGTDNPPAVDHQGPPQPNFIMCMDAETMMTNSRLDPFKCYLSVDSHVRDIRYFVDSMFLAAHGDGSIRVYQADDDGLVQLYNVAGVHNDLIQQLAVNPTYPALVASGGYDQCIALTDLNVACEEEQQQRQKQQLQQQQYQGHVPSQSQIKSESQSQINTGVTRSRREDTVSSLCWDVFQNPAMLIHYSTMHGGFKTLDIRSMQTNAILSEHRPAADGPFCFEQYSEYGFLVGYAKGLLRLVDRRRPDAVVQQVIDPFVADIGVIEYNFEAAAFITAGVNDHSVWRIQDGVAKVWSHAYMSSSGPNRPCCTYNATWWDKDVVLCTSSEGQVTAYVQGFDTPAACVDVSSSSNVIAACSSVNIGNTTASATTTAAATASM